MEEEIVSDVAVVAEVVDKRAPEASYHSKVYVRESPSSSVLVVIIVQVRSSTPSVGAVGAISTIGAVGGAFDMVILASL